MSIEITARHMDVGERVQGYARERAGKLSEEFPTIQHVHVILDAERHLYSAEFIVQVKHHHVEASDETEDMISSIDSAFEKAERQLRKLRDRVVEHR